MDLVTRILDLAVLVWDIYMYLYMYILDLDLDLCVLNLNLNLNLVPMDLVPNL